MESMNRRQFLQLMVGAATVGVFETTLVRTASPESKNGLYLPEPNEIERLAARIRFQGLEDFSTLSALRPNPTAFARSTLMISFNDGGVKEVARVTDFLVERGLEISITNSSERNSAHPISGQMIPSNSPEDPVHVRLTEDTVERYNHPTDQVKQKRADLVLAHELTHVIQQARNPRFYDFYFKASTNALFAALGVSCASIFETLHSHKNKELPDLIFYYGFGYIGGFVIERALQVFAGMNTIPIERHADFQASKLIESASFNPMRGQFFSTVGSN